MDGTNPRQAGWHCLLPGYLPLRSHGQYCLCLLAPASTCSQRHAVSGFPLPKQETGPGSQLLEAPDSWASSWLQPACLGHMDMWGREPAPRKALSLQYVFKDGHHEHEEFLGQDGKACKTCSANVTTACGFDLSRAGLEPRSLKQRPHMIQSVCTCHLKVTSPEPDSEPRPLKQRPHDPVRLHLSPESDDWPTT